MNFNTFSIGRSKSCTIILDNARVSRVHAEITVAGSERLYLVDRASLGGTRVWRDDEWGDIRQGYVLKGEMLAFAEFKISVLELINQITPSKINLVESIEEPLSIKPRRKVDTGEIKLD